MVYNLPVSYRHVQVPGTMKSKKKKKKKKPAIARTSDGKFGKGVCGNPEGRPKGSRNKYSIADLHDAIKGVEEEKGKKLLTHFVEQAFEDKNVLVALMKKMLPDLKSVEALVADFRSAMDDEMAEAIRNKLLERFVGGTGNNRK